MHTQQDRNEQVQPCTNQSYQFRSHNCCCLFVCCSLFSLAHNSFFFYVFFFLFRMCTKNRSIPVFCALLLLHQLSYDINNKQFLLAFAWNYLVFVLNYFFVGFGFRGNQILRLSLNSVEKQIKTNERSETKIVYLCFA